MNKLSARKKRVKRTVSIGKVAPEAVGQVEDLDSRIEAIQWLIPLGLKAVTVYSIGQCNILPTNLIIGDVAHGSNGTTRIVRVTEVGGMASMEERPVA